MRGEIRALTGIRGVAAIAVLFHHFGEKLAKMWSPLGVMLPVSHYGNLGVDLFFILSGMIMTYVYRQHECGMGVRGYRGFMLKRFARIYPNHGVVLLLLMGIWLVARMKGVAMSGEYGLSGWFLQMGLLGWLKMDGGWNYPNWSVSIEWLGYVLFFPLSMWVVRWGVVRKFPLCLGLGLLAIFSVARIFLFVPEGIEKVIQIGIQFTGGVLLYLFCEKRGDVGFKFWNVDVVLLLMVGGAWLLNTFCSEEWVFSWLMWWCGPLLLVLFFGKGLSGWFLSRGWMVYLGRVSYALYISHALVEKVFKVVFPVEKYAGMGMGVVKVGVLGLHVVVPVMFAMVLYHGVEEPMRKWICGWYARREGREKAS